VKTALRIVPPNSFALARSVEYFRIPRSVLTMCVGKSTYARCGIIVTVTPFEPEWEGFVNLEISNTSSLPARIYANANANANANERTVPDPFLRIRRNRRSQLRRSQRQMPGPEGNRLPQVVKVARFPSCTPITRGPPGLTRPHGKVGAAGIFVVYWVASIVSRVPFRGQCYRGQGSSRARNALLPPRFSALPSVIWGHHE
jgi:hypothetical protein